MTVQPLNGKNKPKEVTPQEVKANTLVKIPLAGLILPLSRAGMASIACVLPADGEPLGKGDLIQAPHLIGFMLVSAKPGERFALCTHAKLTQFPNPFDKPQSSGTRLFVDAAGKKIVPYRIVRDWPSMFPPERHIGYTHKACLAQAEEPIIEVVFGYY